MSSCAWTLHSFELIVAVVVAKRWNIFSYFTALLYSAKQESWMGEKYGLKLENEGWFVFKLMRYRVIKWTRKPTDWWGQCERRHHATTIIAARLSNDLKFQPTGWRSTNMSIEHIREHISRLWSDAMNNRTASAKAPNGYLSSHIQVGQADGNAFRASLVTK